MLFHRKCSGTWTPSRKWVKPPLHNLSTEGRRARSGPGLQEASEGRHLALLPSPALEGLRVPANPSDTDPTLKEVAVKKCDKCYLSQVIQANTHSGDCVDSMHALGRDVLRRTCCLCGLSPLNLSPTGDMKQASDQSLVNTPYRRPDQLSSQCQGCQHRGVGETSVSRRPRRHDDQMSCGVPD